jgi:hypothetical protein
MDAYGTGTIFEIQAHCYQSPDGYRRKDVVFIGKPVDTAKFRFCQPYGETTPQNHPLIFLRC